MPTIKEWTVIHADLMQRLHLPCRLNFSTNVSRFASHSFDDYGTCTITINLEADFRVPHHLILHEAAHHRVCAPYVGSEDLEILESIWCHYGLDGHCEHWAQTLCDMYRETGIPLPQTTSFIEFAKAAGIVRKNFVKEE